MADIVLLLTSSKECRKVPTDLAKPNLDRTSVPHSMALVEDSKVRRDKFTGFLIRVPATLLVNSDNRRR